LAHPSMPSTLQHYVATTTKTTRRTAAEKINMDGQRIHIYKAIYVPIRPADATGAFSRWKNHQFYNFISY